MPANSTIPAPTAIVPQGRVLLPVGADVGSGEGTTPGVAVGAGKTVGGAGVIVVVDEGVWVMMVMGAGVAVIVIVDEGAEVGVGVRVAGTAVGNAVGGASVGAAVGGWVGLGVAVAGIGVAVTGRGVALAGKGGNKSA
jgi:hypothetical protein